PLSWDQGSGPADAGCGRAGFGGGRLLKHRRAILTREIGRLRPGAGIGKVARLSQRGGPDAADRGSARRRSAAAWRWVWRSGGGLGAGVGDGGGEVGGGRRGGLR